MSLRRIAKLFAAQNASQLVTVLQQVLLPPAFLYIGGTSIYGQWLALSAAISYLGTFNYGLQTYTNMQMTILYNRDELQACREVQSAGLRIVAGAFLSVAVLLLCVFAVPLTSLLHLSISPASAHWTLYFLGMQVMASMLFGFFSGSYMVFGEAHRGAHFGNLNQVLGLLTIVGLVLLGQPFQLIAAGQLSVTLLMSAYLCFVDLPRRCPALKPQMQYWRAGSFAAILKPSAQYMLLATSGLLSIQVPILLMQRFLGSDVVVVYSLTRTVYSLSRRVLYVVTNSLSAEITLTFGKSDWPQLHQLYALSERVILLMTPPITFGTMLATPLILKLWVHRPGIFDPGVCITLGLLVSILSIKEHKYQFQFSSNRIEGLSWQTLVAYGVTSLVSIPLMIRFGIQGYLGLALVSEIVQLFYLLHLNDRLFAGNAVLDHRSVYRMLAIMTVCTAALTWPILHVREWSYWLQGAAALGVTLILGAFCYWIFRVDELRTMLLSKLASRVPAFASKSEAA